jgi:diphthine-ammonia ligase
MTLQLPVQVLHVKSMSEWAPLCIGPYAQANTVFRNIVLVAGNFSASAHS